MLGYVNCLKQCEKFENSGKLIIVVTCCHSCWMTCLKNLKYNFLSKKTRPSLNLEAYLRQEDERLLTCRLLHNRDH